MKFGELPTSVQAFVAAVDKRTPEGYTLVSGDYDNSDEFSWRQCETCGTHLGGSRHEFLYIKGHGATFESIKVMGCSDCLFYVANGELPEHWRSH